MHWNYSWVFNVYTNPFSSIIIEPTIIKIIRSQHHMIIIIIRHHSWWYHEIEAPSTLLALCKRNPSLESTHKWPVMRTFDVCFPSLERNGTDRVRQFKVLSIKQLWRGGIIVRTGLIWDKKSIKREKLSPLMFPLTLDRTNFIQTVELPVIWDGICCSCDVTVIYKL